MPMSSPQMTRMFGFFCCACAVAVPAAKTMDRASKAGMINPVCFIASFFEVDLAPTHEDRPMESVGWPPGLTIHFPKNWMDLTPAHLSLVPGRMSSGILYHRLEFRDVEAEQFKEVLDRSNLEHTIIAGQHG